LIAEGEGAPRTFLLDHEDFAFWIRLEERNTALPAKCARRPNRHDDDGEFRNNLISPSCGKVRNEEVASSLC
jgi:hypothetical protein